MPATPSQRLEATPTTPACAGRRLPTSPWCGVGPAAPPTRRRPVSVRRGGGARGRRGGGAGAVAEGAGRKRRGRVPRRRAGSAVSEGVPPAALYSRRKPSVFVTPPYGTASIRAAAEGTGMEESPNPTAATLGRAGGPIRASPAPTPTRASAPVDSRHSAWRNRHDPDTA